ncbi:MAG: sigma 54-interacting transcriptional regulator [Proteobacteria bacterium]|nr:sigma 54-interacting transcriptional regulator [Pseudomonadota bacterium]MBU1709993.1 sigma 54-interacting transcriptional regulator [Pseudomonadota bacterium]
MLEYTPIPQFAIDLHHKITFWNKACELLTGLKAAEMIGTDRQWVPFYPEKRPTVADLILTNDFENFLELYKDKFPAVSNIITNAWEATDKFENIGNRLRYIYFLAAPITDPGGKIIGAIETLQDITTQKLLELSLHNESEQLRKENLTLRSAMKHPYRFGDIIGKSKAMQEVYKLILKAAATDTNVIISGESGTGKELVARAIHDLSPRKDHEFVTVNCGAIPENLIESEFFGYKKGAFSGADSDKDGLLDLADQGTLFLDEVGQISLSMQVKLLRVLEDGGYTPVGSNRVRKPDIRFIAATNTNLNEMVAKGRMREDFFYRIHIIPIHIPPLRERKEDIRLLVDFYWEEFGSSTKRPLIPESARELLQKHDWPGNIRELQNVLHRLHTLNTIELPEKIKKTSLIKQQIDSPAGTTQSSHDLGSGRAQFEKQFITEKLQQFQWHKTKTAAEMGISRKTLFRKMKKLGLL